jgi:MFS family permease
MKEELKTSKTLYIRQAANSFGGGLINPFVPIYAVQLGASAAELGWLRSLNNLFSNVMQILWGIASDRVGRYVPFIVIGGAVSSLLWLPMLFVTTTWQLIFVVAVQALSNSMVAPAWAALLGRILPKAERATGTANVNAAASLGTISATLISGLLMQRIGGAPAEMYRIPLLVATVSGFVASMAMLTLKEKNSKGATDSRKLFDLETLRKNKAFRRFTMISLLQQFFMSMAWPLFSITIVNVTRSDMLQVAFISVMSPIVAFLIRRYAGRLSDRAGRKPLIVIGRTGMFLYPLFYAFSSTMTHLLAAEVLIGVVASISDIAIFAYLLDTTADDQRGASIAVYNTLIGFATFFGSILGGYFVGFFGFLGLDTASSLKASYIVSSSGRLVSGLLFLLISERLIYHSTVREELVSIVTEDVETAKYRIQKVDELGERAELDLMKEIEQFESEQSSTAESEGEEPREKAERKDNKDSKKE